MSISQDVSRPGGALSRFSFGNAGGVRPTLEHQHLLFGSYPKGGKSRLVADCPTALVLNFDRTYAHPKARAAFWPVRTDDGFFEGPTDARKKIKPPVWEDYLRVVDELERAAERNTPGRPTTIALDTISAMVPLVQDYVVSKSPKSTFQDMGQDGWAQLNSTIGAFRDRIFGAGYGLIDLVHVAPELKPIWDQTTGREVMKKETAVTLSNKLWQRIMVGPSLMALIGIKAVRGDDGKMYQQHVIKIDKNILDTNSTGTRVTLPGEIPLSADHPWDDLAAAWNKGIEQMTAD